MYSSHIFPPFPEIQIILSMCHWQKNLSGMNSAIQGIGAEPGMTDESFLP
jgi:hypothetical protein